MTKKSLFDYIYIQISPVVLIPCAYIYSNMAVTQYLVTFFTVLALYSNILE